jgi:hypothetical protein
MCVYITAVVPTSALNASFAAVVEQHRLSFQPCDNPYVQRQLKLTEHYLAATRSVCDCGTPWFDSDVEAPRAPKGIDREVEKLLKKPAKKSKSAREAATGAPPRVDPRTPDWPTFLERALAVRGVSYIALVGHSYSGGIASDELTLISRERHLVQELRDGTLRSLEHDVIHEFRIVDYARRVW